MRLMMRNWFLSPVRDGLNVHAAILEGPAMTSAICSTRGITRISACLLGLAAMVGPVPGGEVVTVDTPKRSWGTEQVLGEPDTMMAGDIETAWASLSPDEKQEWLILGYAEPVLPKTLAIHETYNPGAVERVTVFDPEGNEVLAWEGEDPTAKGSGKGISVIPLRVDFEVQRVKVYINSPAVAGWNEIDAVALTSNTGEVQWAAEAEASTTYASQSADTPEAFIAIEAEELEQMQAELEELRAEVERLRRIEEELLELKEKLRNQ
jgi:hypothetical protein